MLAFSHVHSHDENPLNELAVPLRKQRPKETTLQAFLPGCPPRFTWLITHSRIGCGSLTPPKKPYQTVTTQPSTVHRTFTGAFITFNCNSLKEGETPTQDAGVTPFPGNAAMLEKQFAKCSALIVGIQEAHSRSPSLSNLGQYIRVIPPFGGEDGPQGDVEIWINSKQPWDPKHPATVIQEHHLQITAWGPKYFIQSIKTRRQDWTSLVHKPFTHGMTRLRPER